MYCLNNIKNACYDIESTKQLKQRIDPINWTRKKKEKKKQESKTFV